MIWTILWILWGLAFAAIEVPALILRQPRATLSEHIWSWFAVKDQRPTARIWALRGALLVFLIWLTGHLAFGWWSL